MVESTPKAEDDHQLNEVIAVMSKNRRLRTELSKYMAYILRHGAEKEKIQIRPDGYVSVYDLLKHKGFGKGKKVNELHVRAEV